MIAMLAAGLLSSPSQAADVIVVGDTRLKPVVDMLAGIRQTCEFSTRTYQPAVVRGTLRKVVEGERAKVVVVLGKEMMDEALRLPQPILVIYDLVVTPPAVSRPNTTGFYMGTPVREYVSLIEEYLHSIRRVAVVGTPEQLNVLDRKGGGRVVSYSVKNPAEFVEAIRRMESADAILLPPDITLLTATAMEEAYLLSFRKKIPLLGISEKSVREGALLALVFEPSGAGRRIGNYASRAVKGESVVQSSPLPPQSFDLYINRETARKMGITLPAGIVRKAKKVFP
jgi:putative ABC transport system substrate-binding protein